MLERMKPYALSAFLLLALAAYATYVVNAGQFLCKLRLARLDAEAETMAENRTMAEVVA